MEHLFIACRTSLADAESLMRDYGAQASLEAAMRAERSRELENIVKFCHWRQVERLIEALASDEPQGTLH